MVGVERVNEIVISGSNATNNRLGLNLLFNCKCIYYDMAIYLLKNKRTILRKKTIE